MNPLKKTYSLLIPLFVVLLFSPLWSISLGKAFVQNLKISKRDSIARINQAIKMVQPYLKDSKRQQYAVAIYEASNRFGIRPKILISIAQQESSFRDNLPEGPAGEIGPCQILKSWLQNVDFRSEFRTATISDLKDLKKNFLFAAWILRELKQNEKPGPLPYWSFYNARKFEPRFRYFQKVNRSLAYLEKHGPFGMRDGTLAYDATPAVSTKSRQVRNSGRLAMNAEPEDRWIPDAIKRLSQQKKIRKDQAKRAETLLAQAEVESRKSKKKQSKEFLIQASFQSLGFSPSYISLD